MARISKDKRLDPFRITDAPQEGDEAETAQGQKQSSAGTKNHEHVFDTPFPVYYTDNRKGCWAAKCPCGKFIELKERSNPLIAREVTRTEREWR